jgi:hypothetical protein
MQQAVLMGRHTQKKSWCLKTIPAAKFDGEQAMADFGDEQQPQQEMQQDPFGDGGVPQQDDGGFAPMNDGGGDFGAQDGGFTPQEDTGFGGGGGMEVQQDDFSGGMAAPQEDDFGAVQQDTGFDAPVEQEQDQFAAAEESKLRCATLLALIRFFSVAYLSLLAPKASLKLALIRVVSVGAHQLARPEGFAQTHNDSLVHCVCAIAASST